jgi:hypothetical protein
MSQSITEADVSAATGLQDRVREHKLAAPRAHVELDHVDANLPRRIEGRERVGRRQGAGSPVADSFAHRLEDVT